MATEARVTSQDNSMDRDVRRSCSLCMEPYRGRSPKILPCFHTFCLPCLSTLLTSTLTQETAVKRVDGTDEDLGKEAEETEGVADGQRSDGGGEGDGEGEGVKGRGVFLCPTCRAPVVIPEGGVAALQTNFYVEDEQSAEGDSPPPVCAMCEEGSQQTATHHCPQCQVNLCRACRRYHDRLMATHTVTDVPLTRPLKGRQPLPPEQRCCLVHQEALCFHCGQCAVNICLHCKLTTHEGHDTADLTCEALSAKREMPELIEKAQQQLKVMDSSLQQVEREDRQLTRHTEHVTQQINARYDTLVAWARKARDQLLGETASREAKSRSELAAERSATNLTRDSFSSLLARASRAASTDPEVVMVKNELKAALLSEDRQDQHKRRAETATRAWGWDYSAVDASVLHADDVTAFMGQVAEGTQTSATKPVVSLRDLADRVDRWTNQVTNTTNDITSQLTSCKDDVTALQKKGTEMEKRVTSLNDDVSQSKKTEEDLRKKTDSLNADLQKRFTTHDVDISAQRRATADLQKTTLTLKGKMDISGRTDCFTAVDMNRQKTKKGSAIVFSKATANNVGGYSTDTGHFTAIAPGSYLFTCSVGATSARDNMLSYATVTASIMVDATPCACIRASSRSVGCGSVSVQLKGGQKVWVKAGNSAEDYNNLELCFSGSLVQPDLV